MTGVSRDFSSGPARCSRVQAAASVGCATLAISCPGTGPGTAAELAGIRVVAADAALSRRIRVPVLLAVGQDDKISCGPAARHLSCATAQALLARERPDYSGAASLSAYVLPGAGHDLNLATDAPQWFTAASQWITQRVAARR